MAARLVVARLRSRLSRFSLVGEAGPHYQQARTAFARDGLEAASTSDDFSRLGERSNGRIQHSRSLWGMSIFNLSDATLERSAPAPGIVSTPGIDIRQQHTDEWLVHRAAVDRTRRQARQRIRPVRRDEKEDGFAPFVSSQRDYIVPATSEEETLAPVLGRPDLIVTRNVEWANLAFGFEQQNKYVIMDPREPQAPVGYILEDSNVLLRQFLRRRRPFVALVLDAYGNEICRVRRPIWLINSTIFVEVNGKVIGEGHRRWHLWRRVYDCYLGTKQFAAVDNPGFWYWTFTLHDENQGVLAVIDRNWRGFGFEFLTDAGQYVVRFGDNVPNSSLQAQPPRADLRLPGRPILSGSPTALNEMQQLRAAAQQAEELHVVRPLSLSERAVVLALAVSLDNDYFSTHSSGFGFIPLPFFGGSEVSGTGAGVENDTSRNSESTGGISANDATESWPEDGSNEGDADFLPDPVDEGTDYW
ncbi:unnamed protein product [Calypogeia fissa]